MAQKRFSDNPEYFASTQSGTYELEDDDIIPLSHDPADSNTDGKVTVAELAKKVAVDSVADGNMNPVTSNAVYDALPNKSTSTTIKMTITNTSDGITGPAVNTTLFKFGPNWGVVIGQPYANATGAGNLNCSVSITGATLIDLLSINGWQAGNVTGFLGYNQYLNDFWICNCISNQFLFSRVVALVTW